MQDAALRGGGPLGGGAVPSVDVKMSGVDVIKPDPSSILLSLRHGTQITASHPTPDWFATAMLNLSSPPSAHPSYPLPDKVQLSLLGRDCQVTIKRLNALNLSVSPPSAICVAPSERHRSFFPPHVKKKGKISSTMSDTRLLQASCVQAPNKSKTPILYSFLPAAYIDYGPHRLIGGFHVGKFTAYCPLSQTFDPYVCHDHGQYPSDHSHTKGAMAILCQKLGIRSDSNVQNTCLPLHVLIGIIDNGIMTVDEIFSRHRAFVRGLLNSRTMRDGYPTVAKMFRVMDLEDKICLRIIDRLEHNTFTLLDRFFGDIRKRKIYLAHVPWHFS